MRGHYVFYLGAVLRFAKGYRINENRLIGDDVRNALELSKRLSSVRLFAQNRH
jgi:hypothetical protein